MANLLLTCAIRKPSAPLRACPRNDAAGQLSLLPPKTSSGRSRSVPYQHSGKWRAIRVAYLGLWHKDFLGWPSVNAAPVHKDHITDWIAAQTSKGLAFKIVEFKPAAIQVNDDVAVTCYWITYKWLDKDGNGAAHTLRITHTLLRDGKDWHIIGGMSMPEGANAQK